MEDYTFTFEMDGRALQYICKAFDKYVEKWPGGRPEEQEMLKEIQLGLNKALLDYHFIKQR